MEEKSKNKELDKSNKFDKIIKENIDKSAFPIVNKLFSLDILETQLSEIDPLIQSTRERESDVLRKVTFEDDPKKNYLLQIEFQSKNETDMNIRMGEYFMILLKKHRLPVHQYVIYIGDEKMTMKNSFEYKNIKFRFDIIDIRDIDYEEFLEEDIPEFVILGILAKFDKGTERVVAKNILDRIITITETDIRYKGTLKQEKYLKQIDVMSGLRGLRGLQNIIIETINNMPITLDITKDLRYQEGKQIGEARGEARGKEIGKKEGETIGEKKEKFKNILKGYSKGMSLEELADLFEVSIDYVKNVIKSN